MSSAVLDKRREIRKTTELLTEAFEPFLYASNPVVAASLESMGFEADDIRRIELFDWFQGVGIYGLYELYCHTKDAKVLECINRYLVTRIEDGLPAKNINSMAPMLTMVHLLEVEGVDEATKSICDEICQTWALWLYEEHPRTECGGLSHLTCEAANADELWDDTLFMSVLFLAKAGIHYNKPHYVEEAAYQFLLHMHMLEDKRDGLWYHGWTFGGNHNFAGVKWNRGNAWVTVFVPLFLSICKEYPISQAVKRMMVNSYKKQVKCLMACVSHTGIWPTVLDDSESYDEASGSSAFLYGMLLGIRTGLWEDERDRLMAVIEKGVGKIMELVDDEGILGQVSGGTAMGKTSSEFYKKIPLIPKPYGQALALILLTEYDRTCEVCDEL